ARLPDCPTARLASEASVTRIVRPLALLGALLVLNFALPRLLPGDPVGYLQAGGGQDMPVALSPEARARLLRYYGLDRPLPAQFGHYLLATAHGDLGFSIHFNQPVGALVAHRIGWTLLLAGGSLALAAGLGWLLGLAVAWRARSGWATALGLAAVLAGSLPEFVVGLALLVLLAVTWPLFPTGGALAPFQVCGGGRLLACAGDAARHAVLPGLTLTLAHLPAFFLLARGAVVQELGAGYVAVARAKGLAEPAVALRHVARNAAAPALAYLAARVGLLLGGVVIVETLFAYPGLGQLTFVAIEARDYPLLEALFLIFGLAVLAAGLLGDLLLARLDPRRRYGVARL
ncbi:MAG TPA: ABC transporter permease, partial [Thermomicrobiales bacterium]|nr:ABC transporter permease [Thermomicrobiales bacterium]